MFVERKSELGCVGRFHGCKEAVGGFCFGDVNHVNSGNVVASLGTDVIDSSVAYQVGEAGNRADLVGGGVAVPADETGDVAAKN